MIRITDPDDPAIAPFRDIRERDLRRRDGLFIAEGKVVLNVLFAARRFEIVSVLILENRLGGMADTLALMPEGVPVHIASQDILDRIAGFHLHRGILALGRMRPAEDAAILLETRPPLVLTLAGIANHDNMGALFRNAAAFGAGAVLLDETSCDPLYRKAIRVSVGAVLKTPWARCASAAQMTSLLASSGYDVLALSPQGKTLLTELVPGPQTAILLGAEGEGLPERLLQNLQTVRIAMRGDLDSLNVAAASAIALHHFAR
ncbi:MAG: RNA methyltransferase [Rhizobiaceae bacterium]